MRDRADAASTHRQHHVAVCDHAGERRREFAHVLDKHGFEPSAAAGLVTGGVISVLVFPALALRLLRTA